jgi:hypothetical protein
VASSLHRGRAQGVARGVVTAYADVVEIPSPPPVQGAAHADGASLRRRRTYTGAALARRKSWATVWGQVSTLVGEQVQGKITYDEFQTQASRLLRSTA